MTKYPSILPACLRSSFASAPARTKRQLEMDDGTTMRRRAEAKSLRSMTLSWFFNERDTQIFDGFLEYSCNRGIGEFQINIGQTLTVVRPISRPTYTPTASGWNVSLDVVTVGAPSSIPPATANLPEWPFPFTFERSDFRLKGNPFAMSDIEAGGLDSRNRFRSRVYKYTGRMTMSPEDRDAFWQFYRDSLINGASWFVAPFYSAMSNGRKKARFSQEPSENPNGLWFTIQMELETVDLPIMTRSDYDNIWPFINTYVEAGYVEDGYVGEFIIE